MLHVLEAMFLTAIRRCHRNIIIIIIIIILILIPTIATNNARHALVPAVLVHVRPPALLVA